MSAIHRQPLHVDPFDLKPFEAIGRQGLLLALVFVGGITLSIIFVGFQSENVRFVAFWLSFVPPFLVPIAIFFLIMLPTHRVLSAEKTRELETVRRQIVGSCRGLSERIGSGGDSLALSQQVLALSAYEKRLEQTPTWPYNTRMIRTLFFSVLVPAGTFLARVFGDVFVPWPSEAPPQATPPGYTFRLLTAACPTGNLVSVVRLYSVDLHRGATVPTDSAPRWPRGEDEVPPPEGSLSAPGRYEIRVGGRVDLAWSDYFEGMSISHEEDDVTALTGTIVDQAALHGLLTRIRDLGLPLLSLRMLEDRQAPER